MSRWNHCSHKFFLVHLIPQQSSYSGASAIKCGNLTRNSAEAQFQSPSNCQIENTASAKQAKERSPRMIADNLLARLASLVFSFPFRIQCPVRSKKIVVASNYLDPLFYLLLSARVAGCLTSQKGRRLSQRKLQPFDK
jgi:hypothetical protein